MSRKESEFNKMRKIALLKTIAEKAEKKIREFSRKG